MQKTALFITVLVLSVYGGQLEKIFSEVPAPYFPRINFSFFRLLILNMEELWSLLSNSNSNPVNKLMDLLTL